MPRKALTKQELELQEREAPAFGARTLIDDMAGKLTYVRNQLWMELPDGFEGLLHDAEEAVEKLLASVEGLELPADARRLYDSDSKAFFQICSCGQMGYCWPPEP